MPKNAQEENAIYMKSPKTESTSSKSKIQIERHQISSRNFKNKAVTERLSISHTMIATNQHLDYKIPNKETTSSKPKFQTEKNKFKRKENLFKLGFQILIRGARCQDDRTPRKPHGPRGQSCR